MNKTDPKGLYTCGGDQKNCGAVAAAVTAGNEALKSGKLTTKQVEALSKVLTLLGKAGQANGVNVTFSDRLIGAGQASIDSKTKDVTITLNDTFAKNYTKGYPGADARAEQSALLMHEGQHGVDERAAGRDPVTASEERATEHNAYSVASSVFQGLDAPSRQQLWNPGWPAYFAEPLRNSGIDAATEGSVQAWCQPRGNCE
jgi:hypothetical protein